MPQTSHLEQTVSLWEFLGRPLLLILLLFAEFSAAKSSSKYLVQKFLLALQELKDRISNKCFHFGLLSWL
jgi:hypothetical protein